jgi:hypothetical protein
MKNLPLSENSALLKTSGNSGTSSNFCDSSDSIVSLIGTSSDCLIPDSSTCNTNTVLGRLGKIGNLSNLPYLVGNPDDCFSTGTSCQNTLFGKINDILYDKLGAQTNIAGRNTLFQIVNLIKEDISQNPNSFNEETIFGLVSRISSTLGDCPNQQTICQTLENLGNSISGLSNLSGNNNLNLKCLATVFTRVLAIMDNGFDVETAQFIGNGMSGYPQFFIDRYNYIKNIDWTGFCD